ncbi:MAG: radical SAM protein, partial [Pseudomonadales bacterium]|nr:radical SAM protein [Pseudomonadales bacterium]
EGFPKTDDWAPGELVDPPRELVDPEVAQRSLAGLRPLARTSELIAKAERGERLSEDDVTFLFSARGADLEAIRAAADGLRKRVSGDVVRYVVNRNINYTNICYFKCQFCAFSKGKLSENLRGAPYDLDHDEIIRRAQEAWDRGATEVCMQGGIHPDYTGRNYLEILHAVKGALPDMHVHAFSPLEVWQGAATLGLPITDYLRQLKEA